MVVNPPENSTHPDTREQWRHWLSRHHQRKEGVWLVMWKKSSGRVALGQDVLGYDAAVEEALCFGWVDSKPNKLDDTRTLLWFAPRKAGTGWSRLNKARVEKIIANGTMAPAGAAKVAAAQSDGSWAALDEVEALQVPSDLTAALARHGDAAAHFAAFPRSVQRGILEWIASAKTATTRSKRVDETAQLAAENRRANQWPKAAR